MKKLTIGVIIILVLLTGCIQKPINTSTPSSTATITTSSQTSEPPISTTSDSKPSVIPEVEQLKVVGQIGGPTKTVSVSGNFAYVGVGMRVTVLDISDPTAPSEIGATQTLGGEVRDIAISGSFAYVAAGGGGLYIVDISDPSQPVLTGQSGTPGYSEGIIVAGSYAYIADGPTGLRIVNTSDPAKPSEIAEVYNLNYVFDVSLAGKYAYLAAAGAGLLVVDISDPNHPLETGSYDTTGYSYGVTVSGNSIYIADGWEGVQVFDISNLAQPEYTGTITTPGWAMDVIIDGKNLYIADAFAGLRVVDITDNIKATEIGSYAVSQGHAAKLAIDRGVVYVADIYKGLHIVDVTIPSQPHAVCRYSPMGSAHAVAVQGEYAYIAGDTYGFRVIDLADPSKPREVAAIELKDFATSIAISGTAAYVAIFGDPCNLYTFDISNPLHPRASSIIPFTVSRSLCIQGTTLYNAGESSCSLIDLSNPLQPSEIFSLVTSEDSKFGTAVATGVAVVGNIAYLAASQGGLYIMDFSNPTHPAQLGVFNEPGVFGGKQNPLGIMDVVVSGKFAYVLDNQLVRILDISNPKNIKEVSSFDLPDRPFNGGGGAAMSLAISENTLYVADNAAGLLVLDVTDPANPRLVAEASLSGLASWVFVDEKYVYVAAMEGGLYIIEKPGNKTSANVSASTGSSSTTVEEKITGHFSNSSSIITDDLQNETVMVTIPPKNSTTQTGVTYTVSSSADDGPATLRECLQQAQSGDIIVFDPQIFPSENPTTIYLKSKLVLSQGDITVDGSNSGVVLDGSRTGKETWGCFEIPSNYNIIKGLQILNFPNNGIFISGQGNIIGGDRTKGKGPLGEGNLISGNGMAEIGMKLAFNNLIIGNYIGTDISGKKKMGHPWYFSIILESASFHNRIQNNVVAETICFNDFYSSYNEVIGNYIGTDTTGTLAFEGNAYITVNSFSRIGGTSPEERNVINGRVVILKASDVPVLGNYIGTDSTGKVFGTNVNGIGISEGGHHNFIGGTTKAERNVINGGQDSQLISLDKFAEDNFIAGNYLGTDITGTASFPNVTGIAIGSSTHNYIQQNVVSGSSEVGINLSSLDWDQPGADFNFIRANKIIRNTKTGIGIKNGESNLIIGNSFINNGRNGYDGGKNNLWDGDSFGNYWSDYTGKDKNGDNVGDSPYKVFPNGIDNFPLMKPPG